MADDQKILLAIITRARSGDERAFEEFLAAVRGVLHTIVNRDRQNIEVDDARSVAYAGAWRAIHARGLPLHKGAKAVINYIMLAASNAVKDGNRREQTLPCLMTTERLGDADLAVPNIHRNGKQTRAVVEALGCWPVMQAYLKQLRWNGSLQHAHRHLAKKRHHSVKAQRREYHQAVREMKLSLGLREIAFQAAEEI